MAIAKLLLDHGAFVNIPGLDNDTPLHDAVQSGRLECAQLLVRRGANKHARFAIQFSWANAWYQTGKKPLENHWIFMQSPKTAVNVLYTYVCVVE